MNESPADNDVINLAEAARRIPGGTDGVKQMLPDLMLECAQQLEAVRMALVAGDADKVRLGAHTIKGSAAVFSAARVASAALEVEEIGRSGNLDAAMAAIESLAEELDRLGQVLAGHAGP